MKALLINPQTKSIDLIEINNHADIVKLVGFETIASDEVGGAGDRLFFDEECFLRGSEGRFQIDNLVPVSGKGVVVAAAEDGTDLHDVNMDDNELVRRIKFL